MMLKIQDKQIFYNLMRAEADEKRYMLTCFSLYLISVILINVFNPFHQERLTCFGYSFLSGFAPLIVYSIFYSNVIMGTTMHRQKAYKGVFAETMKELGYQYTHLNCFKKDGMRWFVHYPEKDFETYSLIVELREWRSTDELES